MNLTPTQIIITLWLVSVAQLFAQPTVPESRGCDCQCMACTGCMFENPTACPLQSGGGDIDLESLGVDCVVVDASADSVDGTDGDDCIMITGSSTVISGRINGNGGDDCIVLQDQATVEDRIRGDNGDDCIRVTESTTAEVRGSDGMDDIIFQGSRTDASGSFMQIDADSQDDCIRVLAYNGVPSSTGQVRGRNENDCIEVQNSEVQRIRGGNGDDTIYARCSSIFAADGRDGEDTIILSSITVPVSSTENRIVRGGDGQDLIIIEDEIQNLRGGRIDGGDGEDVCCLADQMGTEIRDCETPTTCVSPCPMSQTSSTCNRRLHACIALTT